MLSRFVLLATLVGTIAHGADDKTFKFRFENKDISDVVKAYAKETGQKFIMDGKIAGKIQIINEQPVTKEVAFNDLSQGLALNGYAISENGDTLVVMSARNIQRSLIPVVTELPPLKPERMVSIIYELKDLRADQINKELRILPSKDGELSVLSSRNALILTDWVSNVHRVSKTLAELERLQPAGPPPPPKPGKN